MYNQDSDTYICDLCGSEFQFISAHQQYGPISECENCGKHFCDSCFSERLGANAFTRMMRGHEVLCPECYAKENQKEPKVLAPAVEAFLSGLARSEALRRAEQVLVDNGVEADEATSVMQAIGYALLGTELYPVIIAEPVPEETEKTVDAELYVCSVEVELGRKAYSPVLRHSRVCSDENEMLTWFHERMGACSLAYGQQFAWQSDDTYMRELQQNKKLTRVFVEPVTRHGNAETITVQKVKKTVTMHVPNNGSEPYAIVGLCYQENFGIFGDVLKTGKPDVDADAEIEMDKCVGKPRVTNLAIAADCAEADEWAQKCHEMILNERLSPELETVVNRITRKSIWNYRNIYTNETYNRKCVLYCVPHTVAMPECPFHVGDLLICKPEERKRTPDNVDFEVYAEVVEVGYSSKDVKLRRYLKQGRLPTFDVILPLWEASKLYKPMNEEERALFLENTRIEAHIEGEYK